MDAGELRRAIQLPARRAGLQLEPGLAEAMIGEVAEEPGGLPVGRRREPDWVDGQLR